MEDFDLNKMKLFFDTSPRKQAPDMKVAYKGLHAATHRSSSVKTSKGDNFFLEKLLWTDGAGQSKWRLFNKGWQVLQRKPLSPN